MDPRVAITNIGREKRTAASSYVDQQTAAARRAETETESFKVNTVSATVAAEVRDARVRKGWTQRQLAAAVNEKVDVVRAFEAATAPPNGALLVKMRRALKG